ncbi:MAG: hypothetical protein K0R34_1047 [Herbinix sp.]|jgi:hypothetical protein|nr:hypothetical protein [Herbinix sp.]
MKKILNTPFFSLCFLGSVIAEAYFIQAGEGSLFSVIALGIVVLITGYLCMDSIRSSLLEGGKKIRLYIDQMYREDMERWNERFNELQNLQKATYTATKKNTATLSEQMEELLDRIEVLEGNNTKALNKLIELQKKALEGQKNALGLEINYNKENTKQLIKVINETGNQAETQELLNKIIEQLENSTQVLQNGLQNMNVTAQTPMISSQHIESGWHMNTEAKVENLTETGWDVDAEVELEDTLIGWKSDAEPIIEEIDNGWDINTEQSFNTVWSTDALQEESEDEVALGSAWDSIDEDLNNLIQGLGNETLDEKTSDFIPSEEEETIPEVVDTIDEPVEESQQQKPEIKPLYDDPNKALSADEIAALFASFGQ